MKAVVMAGGEGTRLRPMTATLPKPLLPVVHKPIMEHVLDLLKRHGMTDTVVTVQFLASILRNYFGDGEELGMRLTYSSEETPLGTAGSVKRAEAELRDGSFLVISGDALTDIDLSALVDFHRTKGAMVTVCLTRVADPVEFGITITDDEHRVQRFLEKPSWGQVFSDTVNTGIYVMEPEVFDHVPEGQVVDWSGDVFPKLLADGLPVLGHVSDGYWEDVGTLESYLRAQVDVLLGKVKVVMPGFEVSPGVWVGEGSDVDPDATVKGPVYIGDYSKVEAGAELREFTVLGSNVVVREGAFVHRSVIHDNVFVGPHTNIRGCVVGKGTDLMRASRVEEGAVIGDECVVEEEAIISPGVKVYPFKTIEAGAVVHDSVIWESRGTRSLFGPRGMSGIVNVEITPELVVRLVSAYASTLRKGAAVTVSRDHSRAARALKRAAIAAFNASAIDVRDLEVAPPQVTRLTAVRQAGAGGLMIRTTPGVPDSVDIVFLDDTGADLAPSAQRKVERILQRGEFRRAFPGEIGDLSFPPRAVESYVQHLTGAVDISGIGAGEVKLVVDCAGGVASLILPTLLSRVGVDVLTVNARLDDANPTESPAERREALARLGGLVASSRAAFGVRFDPVGERLSIVDDTGHPIEDERALLVFLDLIAAERRGKKVALPVSTTRVAEQVCRFHGVEVEWVTTAPDSIVRAAASPDLAGAGDGRGGYVVPEASPAIDGNAAFLRLLGLVARTRLTLSQIEARIPTAHVLRADVETPWAAKGQVMRSVIEAAGGRGLDTTDGVRVVEDDGRWALVLPDPSQAITHLWAEGGTEDEAADLLQEWASVVARAGR
ncbi:MAG TPA: sugar phosphate nucleotidyltransferase [Actinomycetes bacterium]|nr:sugar phosphate nucleotidyltransferase [Actinomycetes bacterium]